MNELGSFVRDARLRMQTANGRQMSQEALAEAAGVSGATISHIESGKMRRPERATLEALASVFGIPYNTLAIKAGMADPPSQRDIEVEIGALRALSTVEEQLEALKKISPVLADTVRALAIQMLVERGTQPGTVNRTPPPEARKRDRAAIREDDPWDL